MLVWFWGLMRMESMTLARKTVVVRNGDFVARRRVAGMVFSFLGIAILLGGMGITFFGDPVTSGVIAWTSLPLGFLLSQVGLYFSHRYVRNPRPDERIDEAFKHIAKDGRMYHYVLPVPHVLLTPAGPIVVVAKFQSGNITVDEYSWKQTGLGLRRFFGQEHIGNPSKEAVYYIKVLAKYISQHVPSVAEKEIPMSAIIVFTTKEGGQLDLKGSAIPAMHYTKVKGFWRQRERDARLDLADYEAIREAFDGEAGEWLAGAEQG